MPLLRALLIFVMLFSAGVLIKRSLWSEVRFFLLMTYLLMVLTFGWGL